MIIAERSLSLKAEIKQGIKQLDDLERRVDERIARTDKLGEMIKDVQERMDQMKADIKAFGAKIDATTEKADQAIEQIDPKLLELLNHE